MTVLVSLAAPPGRAAQDPARAPQRFQSGIDLITVNVTAVDSRGRPVEDLRPRDFTVKVDGKAREVVSAELVRVDAAGGALEASLAEAPAPLISMNAAAPGGRLIAIGVDQTLIVPGSITALAAAASRFVDSLTPRDHVALVTFPEPGPRVDFTTDRVRVREALRGAVGQPATARTRTFPMAFTEALAIHEKERMFRNPRDRGTIGPMTRRVLERGTCEGLSLEELLQPQNAETLERCLIQMMSEAAVHITQARQEAGLSLRRLEAFLADLVPLEGPKTMILLSAGLLAEDLTVLNEVARLAAGARTSIHVVAVDPERDPADMVAALPTGQSSFALQDRQLELTGLETIADRTGGSFVRAIAGTGDVIFERLASELSAWYVVAVERKAGDPDRQRVDVDVRRRGVTARSSRTVVSTAAINAKRGGEELLREAMASPIAIRGLPLRVSTFAQRDAATGRSRLHIAAQIGQPGTPAGEFSVGYVVMDEAGRVVASLGRQLTIAPAGASQPLLFDTALGIDPGVYSVRFGVVDAGGRRGTVVHPVRVEAAAVDRLQTSDLIIGSVPADGDVLHPSVEPRVVNGRAAAYLELYLPEGDPGGLSVSLDIAEGEASPALATQRLNVGAGPQPQWRVASGAVDATVLPGRYVARATVRRGDQALRVLSRPFVLEPTTAARPPVERVRSAPIAPELQRRTASYVSTVVGGLANVVGQEEFTLTGPDRRVTSDLLLVRYPGSDRDLLTFRDVTHVDGAAIAGRETHLVELFLKPIDVIRDRVRQITNAAEDHVPSHLNPIFALAFLQADFQSRFQMTVNDPGNDWPAQVTAVTFVETARPTLLRTGPFGDIDLPTRGTAWVEEGTGRILQSELEIGSGRGATRLATRFTVDERLQIMVPELMRTQNPAGVATYSNFRRFTVETDAVVPDQR